MVTAQQIKQIYPGYTGWNDEASIIADYNKTGGSGKGNNPYALGGNIPVPQRVTPQPQLSTVNLQQNPQTTAPTQNPLVQALITKGGYNPTDAQNAANGPRASELAKEFGVNMGGTMGAGTGMGFGLNQPTIDVNALYEKSYNTPEIQRINAEITAKQKARDEAIAIVGDNPFYSEATRTGQINKINEKYNADMVTLQNERSMKMADAEIKVNLALKQYDINNQAYKDQLSLFNNMLTSGGLTNATGEDIAMYATATGIPTSMIQGILDKQKAEQIKPQLITSTDDNGNVTVTAVDVNTANVINQTSLGTVGGGTGGGGGLGSKNLQKLKNDVANWMNLTELAKKYVGVFSSAEILAVYNTFHQNDAWGPAKETPEQINTMFGGTKAVPFASLSATDQANVNKLKDGIKNKLFTRDEAVNQFPEYAQYL